MIVVEATICYLEATHCRVGSLVERLEVPGVKLVEWKCGEYRNESTYVLHIDNELKFVAHVLTLGKIEPEADVLHYVGQLLQRAARAAGTTGALAFDMRERLSA